MAADTGSKGSGPIERDPVGLVLGGRWEVGGRIGSGGMAAVHRGLDRRLERPVAVKILHPHIAEIPSARERLAREARAMAQLRHPNVIEVYDFDTTDRTCSWLITELVEGMTLRRFLEGAGPLLAEVAALIALDLARALEAAHARGIVHRDVKPDNVLIGPEGRPKLSDFGIAKVLTEVGVTTTGHLVGSPSYMSPEQAEGLPVDHRSDLFSLGVVLFRLVTGELPFRGGTPLETVRRVALTSYPDPATIAPGCAGPVVSIIRRCLEKDPSERYGSATELAGALFIVAEDAGLLATAGDLSRFFLDPVGFQAALAAELPSRLEARAKALDALWQSERAAECRHRGRVLRDGQAVTAPPGAVLPPPEPPSSRAPPSPSWWAGLAAAGVLVAATMGWFATDRPAPPQSAAVAPLEPVPPLDGRTTPTDAGTGQAGGRQAGAGPAPAEAPLEIPAEASAEGRKTPGPPKRRRADASGAPADGPTLAPTRPAMDRARPRARGRKTGPASEPERSASLPPPTRAPPQPSPSDAQDGLLLIGTKRWADVIVDGRLLGRAPIQSRYPLPAGRHQLEARQPSCAPFVQTVEIRPQETTRVRVQLRCADDSGISAPNRAKPATLE